MSFSNLIIANKIPGLVPNDGLITAKISGLYGINSITIKMHGSYPAFYAFICKKDTLFLSSFDLNNALNRSNYYYHSITAQLSLSYHPLTVLCVILVCEKREERYYCVNYISLCFVCTVCTVHRGKNTEKKEIQKRLILRHSLKFRTLI